MTITTRFRRRGLRRRAALAVISIASLVSVSSLYPGDARAGGQSPQQGSFVVFGYNDLGMHCMGPDNSEICILPPFNTLHAQVIERLDDPVLITSGVTVRYSIPNNTHSADKTNFWTYALPLFGVSLAPNVGLAGAGLSGAMTVNADMDWKVVGIPITPIEDSGRENPYPLATIEVVQSGAVVAKTQAVVPVSWEMSCNLCHKTPGISTALDILRAHDRLHGTTLENSRPVLCAACHADNALGAPGQPGVSNLSNAMHSAHASRMNQINLPVDCYACHPGVRTTCLRDVHAEAGMTCYDCHGQMSDVGNQNRNPWVDEPRCGSCHQKAGFDFEQPNTLYRNSLGHSSVHCEACHGSPHAIFATRTAADNVQSLALQGHAGKIDTCTVCHAQKPEEPFFHRVHD